MKNKKKPFLSMTRYGFTKKHYTEEQARNALEGGYILNRLTRTWIEVPDPDVLSKRESRKRRKFCQNQNLSRLSAIGEARGKYHEMKYGNYFYRGTTATYLGEEDKEEDDDDYYVYTPFQIKVQKEKIARITTPRPLISPI